MDPQHKTRGQSVVRRWLAHADIDDGRREGLTTAEHEELTRLRKEVRVLREVREILKKGRHLLGTRDDAMSRFQFVAAEKVNYSVVQLCHVLEVSTSGFNPWQRHRSTSFGESASRRAGLRSAAVVTIGRPSAWA